MRILVVDDHDAAEKSMVDALARQEDVALVDGAAKRRGSAQAAMPAQL